MRFLKEGRSTARFTIQCSTYNSLASVETNYELDPRRLHSVTQDARGLALRRFCHVISIVLNRFYNPTSWQRELPTSIQASTQHRLNVHTRNVSRHNNCHSTFVKTCLTHARILLSVEAVNNNRNSYESYTKHGSTYVLMLAIGIHKLILVLLTLRWLADLVCDGQHKWQPKQFIRSKRCCHLGL